MAGTPATLACRLRMPSAAPGCSGRRPCARRTATATGRATASSWAIRAACGRLAARPPSRRASRCPAPPPRRRRGACRAARSTRRLRRHHRLHRLLLRRRRHFHRHHRHRPHRRRQPTRPPILPISRRRRRHRPRLLRPRRRRPCHRHPCRRRPCRLRRLHIHPRRRAPPTGRSSISASPLREMSPHLIRPPSNRAFYPSIPPPPRPN